MNELFLQQLSSAAQVTANTLKPVITQTVGSIKVNDKAIDDGIKSTGFPWYTIVAGLAAIIFLFVIAFYCVFKTYVEGDWETDTQI